MTFRTGEILSSNFIQPIFLWNDDTPPTQTEGYVAGWGMNRKSGKKLEEIPTKLKVPIHTNAHCWYTEHKLLPISSPRTFCAGSGDGTGVCTGDSWGGLSIKVGSTFYFRGIVSAGLLDGMNCDVSIYSIFTDALKFKLWINQIISEDGFFFNPKVNQANLTCSNKLQLWTGFPDLKAKRLQTCNIEDQKIDDEEFSIAGEPDLSILAFDIDRNKEIKFLPENITKSFSGLIAYRVWDCAIRTINGEHFQSLNNLEILILLGNEIDSIDGD